jgi:uncharacterized protein (TIGR02391 family)
MKVLGKVFPEDQLRAISRALGDTEDGLTNAEIDDLLQYCRVPDEIGPGTKWKRIHYNLWNHQCRRGTRTYALEFIRQAMKPARHISDSARYARLRAKLNKALSFAGLYVDDAGNLTNTEAVTTLKEAELRADALRVDLELRRVHPDVLRFCRAELVEDNYFHAVQEATKSVFDKLRTLTGRHDDGATLVEAAVGADKPILAINNLVSESERSEQKGLANLIKGAYGMFRNPTAHEARIKWDMKKEDAEDLLSLVSLIHRRLDGARKL